MFEVTNMPNYENFMKGIIMDVYLKDENKMINIEIQTTNHGDPPRMARYYQAALGNLTYNYGLEKDGSDSSIIQNEIANHAYHYHNDPPFPPPRSRFSVALC